MAVPSELLDIIDQRILRYLQAPIALGTCSSRDSTGSRAMVVFDGDVSPVPVKVLGTAEVQPPDRVLMVRALGSGAAAPVSDDTRKRAPGEWIVLGGFTRRLGSGSYVSAAGVCSGGFNTNSTSFTNHGDVPALNFVKRYDDTRVQLTTTIGCFPAAVSLSVEFAMLINGVDRVTGGNTWSATLANHVTVTGAVAVSGIPAGTYPVNARWRRPVGASAVGSNTGDYYFASAEEIAP